MTSYAELHRKGGDRAVADFRKKSMSATKNRERNFSKTGLIKAFLVNPDICYNFGGFPSGCRQNGGFGL